MTTVDKGDGVFTGIRARKPGKLPMTMRSMYSPLKVWSVKTSVMADTCALINDSIQSGTGYMLSYVLWGSLETWNERFLTWISQQQFMILIIGVLASSLLAKLLRNIFLWSSIDFLNFIILSKSQHKSSNYRVIAPISKVNVLN